MSDQNRMIRVVEDMNDGKNHYGRYQIAPNKRTLDTVELFIEVTEEIGDSFWMPICDVCQVDKFPVAYLHFKRIGQQTFQLVEVRPGSGPILAPPISGQDVLRHPQGDS